MIKRALTKAAGASVLFSVTACATNDIPGSLIEAALSNCTTTSRPSMVGSCAESVVSYQRPKWTQHPRAPYIASLFSFLNRAGEKLEKNEWDRSKYDSELTSFINRLKIQVAQDDRVASQASVNAFLRGLNSTILCVSIAPGMVQCQ